MEEIMETITKKQSSRRQFITKSVPACAMMCIASGKAFPFRIGNEKPGKIQAECNFDAAFPRQQTYRDIYYNRYREVIALARYLEKELGKEKMINLVKRKTTQEWLKFGQNSAKELGKNDLNSYVTQFRSIENYKNRLLKEVVEDTEKAFELKVTKCIWADTFLMAKAGDIGFAYVCFGDYAWAEGFNPKIKLVRDKTLMQGHDYCNHRYIWTG